MTLGPRRTRLVVAVAGVVVLAGALAGGLLHFLRPGKPIGPMPAAALRLPADVRYVAGIDFRRFAASPLYARYSNSLPFTPGALRRLQAETGLDLARDLTHVLFAGESPKDVIRSLVVLVLGADHGDLARWLERQDIRRYTHEGRTIYILAVKPLPRVAVLLAPDALAVGLPDQVEHAVAEMARSKAPLRRNETLLALVAGLRADAPVWLAYELPAAPAPGGLSPELARALASLRTITMAGELEPAIALDLAATTDTPDGAGELARVIDQAVHVFIDASQESPALKDLASSIHTVQEERQVRVSASIPYALLETLKPPSGERP
jgi:hypothetical protein